MPGVRLGGKGGGGGLVVGLPDCSTHTAFTTPPPPSHPGAISIKPGMMAVAVSNLMRYFGSRRALTSTHPHALLLLYEYFTSVSVARHATASSSATLGAASHASGVLTALGPIFASIWVHVGFPGDTASKARVFATAHIPVRLWDFFVSASCPAHVCGNEVMRLRLPSATIPPPPPSFGYPLTCRLPTPPSRVALALRRPRRDRRVAGELRARAHAAVDAVGGHAQPYSATIALAPLARSFPCKQVGRAWAPARSLFFALPCLCAGLRWLCFQTH